MQESARHYGLNVLVEGRILWFIAKKWMTLRSCGKEGATGLVTY